MRVMIAGGGTGGHIYPGVGMYESLRRLHPDVEALFIGSRGGVERELFNRLGLRHHLIPGKGLRGASALKKLFVPFVLIWSLALGVKAILAFKPDIVVGTGGYASVSSMLAAILCGRKRVLQEQNSVPGLANRLLSRFAHLVLLSYEESVAYLSPSVPSLVVGNPLRFDPMRIDGEKEAAREFFDFKSDIPTILIFGGSQGSHSINRAGAEAARRILREREAQFLFLTGMRDFEWVRATLGDCGSRVKVLPFLDEMKHAYIAADLAVARSGASSVFELAAFEVPSVLIPYPHAADDHQRRNAAPLRALGAAVILEDAELSGERLAELILKLIDDKTKRTTMSDRMRSWAKGDAGMRAAEAITDLVKKTPHNEVSNCKLVAAQAAFGHHRRGRYRS